MTSFSSRRLLKLLLLSLLSTSLGFTLPSSSVTLISNTGVRPTPTGRQKGSQLAVSIASQEVLEQFANPQLYQHVATGGALAFAGDVVAQSLLSEAEEKRVPPKDWDVVRTNAFVTFGALYTGGAQHFIFGFLNSAFDAPLTRLALAQFCFIPFCYYPTFLLMVPTLRAGWEAAGGFGSDEAKARQKELFAEVAGKLPPTLLRNWCFWLPVQFVQFTFVPADLHVPFTSAFGVIWNAILSWSTASAKKED